MFVAVGSTTSFTSEIDPARSPNLGGKPAAGSRGEPTLPATRQCGGFIANRTRPSQATVCTTRGQLTAQTAVGTCSRERDQQRHRLHRSEDYVLPLGQLSPGRSECRRSARGPWTGRRTNTIVRPDSGRLSAVAQEPVRRRDPTFGFARACNRRAAGTGALHDLQEEPARDRSGFRIARPGTLHASFDLCFLTARVSAPCAGLDTARQIC
jgi:hypothetical protein